MIRTIATAALLALSTPALAQYDDYDRPVVRRGYPEYQGQRRAVPPIRGPGYGPQVDPCIVRGDCYGRKYDDRVPQGYQVPPFPGDRY